MKGMKKQLTELELKEIKGGLSVAYATDDVDNKNTAATCKCTYNNTPSVTNTNTVVGCICVCKVSGAVALAATVTAAKNVSTASIMNISVIR